MGRSCPVCGRGMFSRLALKEHIKRYHGWYFQEFLVAKGSGRAGRKKKEQ